MSDHEGCAGVYPTWYVTALLRVCWGVAGELLGSCWGTDDCLLEFTVGSHTASHPRSTLALERQINEMVDTLEKYTNTSEQRHKATDDTLSRILKTLDCLTAANNLTPFLTPGVSPSASPSPPGSKPYLSNPAPTPELIAIISKVVSEARGRVGKRKGGADDNSCKVKPFLNLRL